MKEITKNQIIELLKKINIILDELERKFKLIRIKNKGAGAGGAQTNKNGLGYENTNCLPTILNIETHKIIFGSGINDCYYMYKDYIILKQRGLYNYLHNSYNNNCEKKLNPDECIIDTNKHILYILEKKFQQCGGSVDEKIQTALFKRWYYGEQYPAYTIVYIYVLSDWFKQKKYRPEMRYLNNNNVPVLFSSDPNYITNLLKLLS